MIPHFFQWFMILQQLQHHFMINYWKFLDGLTSGRWYLTQIHQNSLKRLFSLTKQTQVTTELFILIMYQRYIQKHLGFFLDSKLNLFDHINEKFKKATKRVNVIRKVNLFLPRFSLLTIYKLFVRPHLNYGDVIYDQPNNSRFSDKIETVQHNAALAITGAVRGNPKEKLYQDRRWLRRMSYLYKIISTKLPPYLCELIPPLQRSHRYSGCFQTLGCRTTLFQNLFLPFTITEWNKLDTDIDSHAMFRKKLLTFIRPLGNDIYRIYDPLSVRLLNRLSFCFSL